MSEFDFDELDRAVNGAINNPAAKRSLNPVIQPAQTDEPTVVETVESPVEAAAEETSETSGNLENTEAPVEASPAPAARRSSGRFMDMVHPSSDMRTKPSGETVIKAAPVVVEKPATDEAPWREPLESPFLPDAKVEKRPLGGNGSIEEPKEELLEAPEEQELLEAHTMPDPIDFAAANAVINEEVVEPIEEEKPQEESVKEEKLLEVPAEAHSEEVQTPEVVVEPVKEELVGPTSITQQYKEQPSSNQESGAIYDTESYHQPVVAPVKKKSGMLTLVWIFLLIVLGAGAGWAVYTYVLPML